MAAVANAPTYNRWFNVADADGDGRVTGPDAVAFFARSGLPRDALAKVWDLANSSRAGFLDHMAFYKAMDLISVAQHGGEISRDAYLTALDAGIAPPRMAGADLLEGSGGADGTAGGGGGAPGAASSNVGEAAASSGGGGGAPGSPPPAGVQSAATMRRGSQATAAAALSRRVSMKQVTSVVDGLKAIYFKQVRPLEEAFKFGSFFSPLLHESDFEAKPSVLLLGQYSTGKTTFIRHLLGRDYPGAHVGPEPTTDRFVVVQHGLEERRTPGNTMAVQPDRPYQGLSSFGTGFLSRFEGASCPSKLLEELTIIDTPGVLSGEKQRVERNYSFADVCEWFAGRADLILLLFDPYKLDISDEFKAVISALRGHDDKVRVVLNKSDQVDQQQLMRVYGALMWSLGKVFKSPEVCRVYIGSFNGGAPVSGAKNPAGVGLFEAEEADLLRDLKDIPTRSADRKVNEFVKRVRALKIHVLIIGELKKRMPALFGKEKAQRKMLDRLPEVFSTVQREHHLPVGDFPDLQRFHHLLSAFDFDAFPKLSKASLHTIDEVMSVHIPNLVRAFDSPF